MRQETAVQVVPIPKKLRKQKKPRCARDLLRPGSAVPNRLRSREEFLQRIKPCVEAQARPRIPVLIVNESCLPFFVLSLHERHFFSLWPLPF
jgi:hypothetical protein